ncbi:MAG: hypothetical protein AMXMBFR64_33400 [Myxococcales bacterium]
MKWMVLALGVVLIWVAGCRCSDLYEAACEDPAKLAGNPAAFLGKEVCVSGVVSLRLDTPVVDLDWYKVVKDEGSVWVQGASPPPTGTRVTVKGRFVRGKECSSPLEAYVICQTDRVVH